MISPPVSLSSSSSSYHHQLHQPATLTSAAFAQSHNHVALSQPFFQRQSSSSSMREYGMSAASQQPAPSPLSTSSLDQDTIYRGVHHSEQQESTVFAPAHHQTSLWHARENTNNGYALHQPMKKMELTEVQYPIAYTTAGVYQSPQSHNIDLPMMPSHIERFTSFYSGSVPAVIAKALRIGFQTISEMRVDVHEEAQRGKVSSIELCDECRCAFTSCDFICSPPFFSCCCSCQQFRGQAYTEDGEAIQFIARVYRTGTSAPSPYLVEFQRRCGDSVAFFRLYQKMMKSCAVIHSAPYESAIHVAGMTIAPISALTMPALDRTSSLSSMNAIRLDLPSVASLCGMVASSCQESRLESAKCLAKVSRSSDLFPPTLERQVSTPTSINASKAIWSAVVNILTTNDDELSRLGAVILRNCLTRGECGMLLEHLEQDKSVVAHLVKILDQDDTSAEESLPKLAIKSHVAEILNVLLHKKGASFLTSIAPNALEVLSYAQSKQQ